MSTVDFLTSQGLADFATFVARARTAAPNGAIHLRCVGEALVLSTGVLPGEGLSGRGLVLAMRVVRATCDGPVDAVVSFASVTDRLARSGPAASSFSVPPATVQAPWAGQSPPRDGWEPFGQLDAAELGSVAAQGIASVASALPESSGQAAVDAVRAQVWRTPTTTSPAIPSGMAFVAHVMGLLPQQGGCLVARSGTWLRLSTDRGHVLAR